MFGRKQAKDDTTTTAQTETGPEDTRPVRAATLERDQEGTPEGATPQDGGRAGEGKDLPAQDYNTMEERPAPDHPDKVEQPTDLKKPSVVWALRSTVREFMSDGCTDLAAALTYYSVLAIFPAALALLSLLGVVGEADNSVQKVEEVLQPLVSQGTITNIDKVLTPLANAQGAGLALVIGIVGALWSASGYVGAFARAMNKIYEVEEGRPFWKMRPMQLVVTVLSVLLCAAALLILVVSGPVARSIGSVIGLGDTAVTVWSIVKWPVLLLIVVLVVAVLYYATPNVKQPRFRWISLGAFVAIVIWLVASAGFAFYVTNFSSYNKTYGAVAGAIVALLWLWITNLALLFGAELDSELERSRQLQSGIAAEDVLQLPLRDDRGVKKAEEKREKVIGRGRELREKFTGKGNLADRPYK